MSGQEFLRSWAPFPVPRPRDVATVSVIIPAHNEERPLARNLSVLLAEAGPERPEVVVVANGCDDATADVARAAGVRVVELAEASKTLALNAGDAAASTFPRIYLDADVTLSPGALHALAETLRGDGVMAAAPHAVFDVAASSWPVRAFYAVYRRLPYVSDGLLGLGVYGLSAAGRERFGEFPQVTSDDLFVQRLFDPHERATADGSFHVTAPRNLRNLLRVRTRTASGNGELSTADLPEPVAEAVAVQPAVVLPGVSIPRFHRTTRSTVTALSRLALQRPDLLPSIAVYVGVTIASRLMARRHGTGTWHRDHSTR